MKPPMLAGLTCTLLGGSYTYRPLPSVDAAMPAIGTQVEARLTSAGAAALAPQVGPDIRYLQGRVLSVGAGGLTLAVTHAETVRRLGIEWKGEEVTLPREDLAGVEERKLSVGATALVGGLVGGGLVAAFALIGGTGSASGGGVGGPAGGAQ